MFKILGILSFILFFNLQGSAQLINRDPSFYPSGTTTNASCPGTGCEITLPSIKLGETKVYTIPLLVTSWDNIYTSNVTSTCSDIQSNHSISNIDNNVTIQVTEKCGSGVNELSFIFRVEKEGSSPDQIKFHVPVKRDRAKIAYVLDLSGSMNLNVQGTTEKRIDELKEAVDLLTASLESFKQENDSLSLTYFSSNVIQPELTFFPSEFIPIDNTHNDYTFHSSYRVHYDLDPRVPLQMTAMGEGLLDAKLKLDKDTESDVRRMVFLFTDGLQNWGNQLKDDGISFQTGTDSLNTYQSNPKDSIYYYPVATWAAGEHPERLQNIVDANKGEVLFVTPNSNLASWFNNQLVNMLDHGSPQIVVEKNLSELPESTESFNFNLNDNIPKLIIQRVTDGDIKMSIEKDGVDITSKARAKSGSGFDFAEFNFPIPGNNPIQSGGEWKIIMKGESKNPIYISAIADDHFTEYNCSVNKQNFTVGDTIYFKTELNYLGNPLTETTNSVKAVLLKPGDDLGHLMATYTTPETTNPNIVSDSDSDVSIKFNELLASDTSFYNALLPEEQIIDLTNNNDGTFSGIYTNTDLSGIYNVVYLINAEDSNTGKIQRTKTISTIVTFGQVEEETPIIVDNDDNNKSTNILIRPRNKFGYFMGPGYASKLKVKINKKPVYHYKIDNYASMTHQDVNIKTDPFIDKIIDNLDGSYNIIIANITPDDNPNILVSVRDEVMYEGKLKPIPLWYYILIVLAILILIILQRIKSKTKVYKTLVWILFLILVIIYILQKYGILVIF